MARHIIFVAPHKTAAAVYAAVEQKYIESGKELDARLNRSDAGYTNLGEDVWDCIEGVL